MGRARPRSGLVSVAFESLRSLFPRHHRTNNMKIKLAPILTFLLLGFILFDLKSVYTLGFFRFFNLRLARRSV